MKIKAVHQIEITSRCNLRCKYCVHPKMKRKKMDMDIDVYRKALEWVSYCVRHHGQKELNLAGIGESTMHDYFRTMVELARKAVGQEVDLVLATNGVNMDRFIAKTLKMFNVKTWVSLHRPEKAGPAVEILKEYGVLAGVSADPSLSSIDWAGQVNWHVSTQIDQECSWLKDGKAFITAEGDVESCCLDGNGASIIGNVMTHDINHIDLQPYSLCESCHLSVPVELEKVG